MVAKINHHQPTVLLIEEEEPVRNRLFQILVNEGYLVETAASGREAMNALRTPLSPIDVVLLDVDLPDVGGSELCAKVRELYPDLPVVACTERAGPEEAAKLSRLGVHRYFHRPITADELL